MELGKLDQSDLEDNGEITKHIVGVKEVWAEIIFQLKGTACAGGNMMQSENRHVAGMQKVRGNTASLEREADVRRCEEYVLAQEWERSQHLGAATATGIWVDIFLEGAVYRKFQFLETSWQLNQNIDNCFCE